MWDILRQLNNMRGLKRTKYAVVNVRVKALEAEGFVRKTGERDTKQGGETVLYEMTARAQLAVELSSKKMDELINNLNEDAALTILRAISRSKQVTAHDLFDTQD